MVYRRRHIALKIAALAGLLALVGFTYTASQRFHKEYAATSETKVKASIEAGVGKVNLARGKSSNIVELQVETEQRGDLSDYVDYTVRSGVGYLNLNTTAQLENKKHSIHITDLESNTWNMMFTDAVPLSFEIELGLGSGKLDFTGMQVKDLTLSAGASSVEIRWDAPNKSTIEDMSIEAGLSKFRAVGLGNANFHHLKFEGGVGSYILDFGGTATGESDVDIEVGLGTLTLHIPDETGVKVNYDKNWLSHLSIDKDLTEQQEDTFVSSNYYSSSKRLNIHIEAGLGSVAIHRD
jgi:hypothetical protein